MGFPQSNIRLNNYWENTYNINPASIDSRYQFVVSSSVRKQWFGFPGAPNTKFVTLAARISPEKRIQFGQVGIKAYFDEIGYTSLINISPSYSYSVKWNKKLLMNLGIAGSYQSIFYDITKATFASADDPAKYSSYNKKSIFNTDVGIEFIGESFLIGAVSQNLASLLNKENNLMTNTNFAYAMYRTKYINVVYLQSGICVIQNKNLTQLEFNFSSFFNFNSTPDFFQLGILYRTTNEIGAIFSIDLPNSLRFGYSYDYNLGSISYSSTGTHEISLIWKFGKLPICNTCTKFFK
jgi:type IX secretion system PorP/SprF family membrane protein